MNRNLTINKPNEDNSKMNESMFLHVNHKMYPTKYISTSQLNLFTRYHFKGNICK